MAPGTSYSSIRQPPLSSSVLFRSHATATTEIYTLSLHDALPILLLQADPTVIYGLVLEGRYRGDLTRAHLREPDRKSTRLNSSHTVTSYAVFCLKKKRRQPTQHHDSAAEQRK